MENRNDWIDLDELNDGEKIIVQKFLETNTYYAAERVYFARSWNPDPTCVLLDGYFNLEALKFIVQIMELLEEYQKSQEKTNESKNT